jgi:integrase
METYLSKKRRDAETGQISFKMYGEHKLTLDDFLGFCDLYGSKKGKPITTVFQIDSELLWSYQATQFDYASREKKSDGKISLRTVRKRLASASRFVKWLEVGGAIDQLPKALKDKNYASVELPDPVPVFFTPDECRRLFVNASQRTKLYIALGLNCGYTQSDIASLTHGMVNWDSGIIDRKRHKTKVSQWHSLWPITLKLLSAEKTKGAKDELILRGENGNPLLTDKINSAKNVSGTDVIKLAFERVKKKLGMKDDRRGFAVFRKTGSNEIERWYPELTEHFLAHAEPGLKRHYVKRHYDELHLAIQRLDRDVFKLSECC